MSAARATREARAPGRPDTAIRGALALGPIVTCVGIAWTAMAPSAFASAAVLVGLVACFYATHRFGRLGVDDGGSPDDAPDAAREASAAEDAGEAERLRKAREDARAREKRG